VLSALVVVLDGLSAYLSACRQAFRLPVHTGKPGRPRLVPWPDVHLGQVIKRYAQRRVVSVERRIVQGSAAVVAWLLRATQNGGVLNTAFIERLIATFRSRLALLVRRTRHLARKMDWVEEAVYLIGRPLQLLHLPPLPFGSRSMWFIGAEPFFTGWSGHQRWRPG
jgi:hypothetical protein